MSDSVAIAVVSTHVIQHFAPLYRRLAQEPGVRIKVFYCSRSGLDSFHDPGFGVDYAWDSDLLSGYESEFLPGAETPLQNGFRANDCPELAAHLAGFKPDFLIIFGYNRSVMLRALRWGNRARVPVAMFSDSELVHPRGWWRRLVKRLVLPRLLRSVNGFLTIGDNNESYLRHYGVPREKLFRSAYPTAEAEFLSARKGRAALRAATRLRWEVGDGDFVALFVGKLIPRKRPFDLLFAIGGISRFADLKRPVVAVFAGDGELRPAIEMEMKNLPAGRCRLLGFVNQRELPATYAAADVLVHPAEMDPHPLTITESAMVGLPVIVSDKVGCIGETDTARPGLNAIVYRAGHVDSLAKCICTLIADPAALQKMEAATLAVAEDHGLTAAARGVLKAVRTLVARLEHPGPRCPQAGLPDR
ncbi:MAG: group 1 glycosyl [Planctomycetota bacterium]|nr:MAG: group 1 glycosyl [Planctomycetota bacterium]